eukprot:8734432-Karenia_brevis.AAC.1
MGCSPLGWDHRISHHRPIVFFRSRGKPKDGIINLESHISEDIIKRVDWPIRLAQRYVEVLAMTDVTPGSTADAAAFQKNN